MHCRAIGLNSSSKRFWALTKPHSPSHALRQSSFSPTAGRGRSTMATAAATPEPAEAVVQKQLEAYNARDIEAFMALMAADCIAKDAVSGSILAQGKEQLRQRYESRFQTAVYSELLGRLCLGDVVVDREIITGLPDGQVADCLATYHCKDGKITRMEFVWQARKQ